MSKNKKKDLILDEYEEDDKYDQVEKGQDDTRKQVWGVSMK